MKRVHFISSDSDVKCQSAHTGFRRKRWALCLLLVMTLLGVRHIWSLESVIATERAARASQPLPQAPVPARRAAQAQRQPTPEYKPLPISSLIALLTQVLPDEIAVESLTAESLDEGPRPNHRNDRGQGVLMRIVGDTRSSEAVSRTLLLLEESGAFEEVRLEHSEQKTGGPELLHRFQIAMRPSPGLYIARQDHTHPAGETP